MKTILRTFIILFIFFFIFVFSDAQAQSGYGNMQEIGSTETNHSHYSNNGVTSFQTEINASDKVEIKVYPNPTFGKITIEGVSSGTLRIYKMNGQMVFKEKIRADKTQFNLQGYTAGVYLMHIHNSDNLTVKKIVVQ